MSSPQPQQSESSSDALMSSSAEADDGVGCNSSDSGDTTQQAAFCPNVDFQAESGNRKDLNKVKPADELLYSSTASAIYNQAGAVGSSLNAETKAVSVLDILPDPQTGVAVVSDILIPTRHDSSAAADYNYMAEPHVSHGSEYDFTGWTIPAELVSLLEVTADRILKESCGEGWLLQPRIANMTRLEYRVYMLNGAEAVSGFLSRRIRKCWHHFVQLTTHVHCGLPCRVFESTIVMS